MNKWRKRVEQNKAAEKSDDSGSHDAELTNSAEDIYSVAAGNRDGVKKKDADAKARRRG